MKTPIILPLSQKLSQSSPTLFIAHNPPHPKNNFLQIHQYLLSFPVIPSHGENQRMSYGMDAPLTFAVPGVWPLPSIAHPKPIRKTGLDFLALQESLD